MLVDADCKVEFSDPGGNKCDRDSCILQCHNAKGHGAKGRCELIDTCVCTYPC